MAKRTTLIGISADWVDHSGRSSAILAREYVSWISSAGCAACVLPAEPGMEDALLERVDALVLSGGGDIRPTFYGGDPEPHPAEAYSHPDRCAFEFTLVWRCMKIGMPVLGVCLGCQTLNAALGGSLVRHLEDPRGWHRRTSPTSPNPLHKIRVVPGTLLSSLEPAPYTRVLSSHHQCIGSIAPGWRVGAYGPDRVVEAIENPSNPRVLGVQWHPERTPHSPLSVRLAAWLIERAREYARSKG